MILFEKKINFDIFFDKLNHRRRKINVLREAIVRLFCWPATQVRMNSKVICVLFSENHLSTTNTNIQQMIENKVYILKVLHDDIDMFDYAHE
jgi:hypothetical protein